MKKKLREIFSLVETPQATTVDFDDPETGRLTGKESYDHWGIPDFVGRSEAGHSYFRVHKDDKYKSTVGYFAADSDGKILMRVRGSQPSSALTVYNVQGLKGSELKAHDFYHHLLKAGHVKKILSDNYLSDGGFHIWKNLARKKDVLIHKVFKHIKDDTGEKMTSVDIDMDDQNDPNTRFQAVLK